MRIGQKVQGTVEKLISGGEGLIRVDGRSVFVPGVCMNETVSAVVVETKKDWARCSQTAILESSPDRCEPFCQYYTFCGGCSWQHMNYQTQLKSKELILRETLKRQAGISLDPADSISLTSSQPRACRSRIRPIILSSGKTAFRETRSHSPIAIDSCPVATDGVNRFLREGLSTIDKDTPEELIVFGDENNFWVEGIHPEAIAQVAGKEFRFPPSAFFQSNLIPLDELVCFVLEAASWTATVSNGRQNRLAWDLYGGAGLFGAFLADEFEQVVGIDFNTGIEEFWMKNTGRNGVFHTMRVEDWISNPGISSPDFILVNPPRRGLPVKVRHGLSRIGCPLIAYVSCNPVSLARDIRELQASGYSIARIGLFDLYPQTPHMETVIILESGQ